jgi:uncharacterized protein YjbJ (UPF0337 family)
MDSNRVKGAVDELVGIAKQKAGELTDNPKLQVKGAVQQVKGKVEKAWGEGKDSVRNAHEEAATGSKPVE